MGSTAMTRKERVLTALKQGQPDRVPAAPRTVWSGIKYIGRTVRDCYQDEDVYVDSQVACVEELGVEAAWLIAGHMPLERSLGVKMLETEDDPASPLEPLINSIDDVLALRKSPNVKGDPNFRYVTSIVSKLRKALGDHVPIIGEVSSPFRCACMLRGTQNLFIDMYEQPDLVKRLVDYCVQPLTELAQMLLEAGADLTQTHCPVASREMISRKHYLEFVHPVHQALYADWEQRIGLPVLFHICGDWNDRLDLVADEGVSGVHIDRTDLVRAKELFGDRVSIMGNVPSTDVMLLGTPEDVERASVECMTKGGPGGGYLLGADCLLARDTPAENVRAMVRAAERYRVYGS